MLHPHVKAVKGDVIHGNGLIAEKPIRKGEIVSQLNPGMPTMTIEEILHKTSEEQAYFFHYGYQCSETHLVFEGEPEHFMNHSCDPNTWWGDDNTIIACRDILAGEEITYDYATTEIGIAFEMVCRCGSAVCRHKITHLDHLKPEWQARYGDYLPTHTRNAIALAKIIQHP